MAHYTDSLAGLTAVVTGASSGIGRAIALELALAGANMCLHARQNAAGLEEVAQAVREFGRACLTSLADLAAPAAQDQLVERAWAWKPIDIWINNAGADVLTGPAASLPFEEKLETLWRVDVVATLRLSRAVGKRMAHRRSGVLLNMGWDQADTGMAGDSGEFFAATKGAVMAATQSLAKSFAPHVRVNCLAPGWIRTTWGHLASETWQQRARQESLLKRWGEPDDVAHAACFLVSPAAQFITGQVIPVNGGRAS